MRRHLRTVLLHAVLEGRFQQAQKGSHFPMISTSLEIRILWGLEKRSALDVTGFFSTNYLFGICLAY
jgi:hypothetical protein